MLIDVPLDAPPDQAAARARELQQAGVDGVFSSEGPHDVFLSLALATQATGLPIMTNVAVALPRSPLHLAHAAHDLHLLSGGRFTLGLGSPARTHLDRRYAATWARPADRVAEVVAATREVLAAWDGGRSPVFEGEFTRHDHMPAMFRPAPLPWGPPPVMMGALGPVMTRRAGEVADGLLLMPFNTRRHLLERALPALQEGVRIARRSPADVAVVPQVIAALGSTDAELEATVASARALVAFHAATPAYRSVLDVEGRGELQPRLQELARSGDLAAMTAAVDDDLFDAVAVRGAPVDCARLIRAKFEGVGDRVGVHFAGIRHSAELLAELVGALHAG